MFDSIYTLIERGDLINAFSLISVNLNQYPGNYELYFLLSVCYESFNPNQAFLCCENALFLCNEEEDIQPISDRISYLKTQYNITVSPVNIIIVSFNCFDMLKENITAIRSSLSENSYKIIVVDNCSEAMVVDWLRFQPDILLLANDNNVGFPSACNQGVNLGCEFGLSNNDIYLLNNDALLTPQSLFWLRMGLYENGSIGATGSISNRAGNRQGFDIELPSIEEYRKYGLIHNSFLFNPYEERIRLSGFSLLVKSKVWSEIGGMDTNFSPGYFEDDDLSMRIRQKGYGLLVCKNSFVYHAGSQSFSKISKCNDIILNNYQRFINIYGFSLVDYADPIETLSSILPQDKNNRLVCLDIGSGFGANLQFIFENYTNATIYGIEEDSAMRELSLMKKCIFPSISDYISSPTKSLDYIFIRNKYDSLEEVLSPLISSIKSTTKIYLYANDKLVGEITIH